MAIMDGGSAFPQIETDPATTSEHVGDGGQEYSHVYSYGGMSLRDWFAGQALIYFSDTAGDYTQIATLSYRMADAMLKAREST